MELLNTPWKMLLVRGVIGLVFGLVAIIWPAGTVSALAVLWGIWALVDGIGLAGGAFAGGPTGPRMLTGLMALVAVLAGLFAIVRPGEAAAALTWVLGIWLIVRGGFELVSVFAATALPGGLRWLYGLGAAVDFLLGVLFVTNPGKSVVGIAVFLGVVALVWGATLVVLAFMLRGRGSEVADSASMTTT